MNLCDYIRAVPDFPIPNILFRDITPLLQNSNAFTAALNQMMRLWDDYDVVAAVESRGFIFAAPIAVAKSKPLVILRKPGKLPAKTISHAYDLEYGKAELHMHEDSIQQGQRVLLIDDVLATGGTVSAATSLIEKAGGSISCCLFLIELEELQGRNKLKDYQVKSLLQF